VHCIETVKVSNEEPSNRGSSGHNCISATVPKGADSCFDTTLLPGLCIQHDRTVTAFALTDDIVYRFLFCGWCLPARLSLVGVAVIACGSSSPSARGLLDHTLLFTTIARPKWLNPIVPPLSSPLRQHITTSHASSSNDRSTINLRSSNRQQQTAITNETAAKPYYCHAMPYNHLRSSNDSHSNNNSIQKQQQHIIRQHHNNNHSNINVLLPPQHYHHVNNTNTTCVFAQQSSNNNSINQQELVNHKSSFSYDRCTFSGNMSTHTTPGHVLPTSNPLFSKNDCSHKQQQQQQPSSPYHQRQQQQNTQQNTQQQHQQHPMMMHHPHNNYEVFTAVSRFPRLIAGPPTVRNTNYCPTSQQQQQRQLSSYGTMLPQTEASLLPTFQTQGHTTTREVVPYFPIPPPANHIPSHPPFSTTTKPFSAYQDAHHTAGHIPHAQPSTVSSSEWK
jgi:hypothetical protein